MDGSVPPGVPTDIYARIIREANKLGVKAILDASGELLTKGIKAKPYLIKPNKVELEASYGEKLKTTEDIVRVARRAISAGVSCVCVSCGSEGALFITEDRFYEAAPIKVPIRGVQGAGDSMVAGFCYALMHGMEGKELFAHAVACATGSLLHPGTKLCEKTDMKAILKRVQIKKIS